jgi:hypothetical protein
LKARISVGQTKVKSLKENDTVSSGSRWRNTDRKSHVHGVEEKDDPENASKIRVSHTFLLSWRQKLPFPEVIRQREVLEDAIDDTGGGERRGRSLDEGRHEEEMMVTRREGGQKKVTSLLRVVVTFTEKKFISRYLLLLCRSFPDALS